MTDHQATESINVSPRRNFSRRLRAKVRSLWPRLLNYPIPLGKGYTILAVVPCVVFGLTIGILNYVEGQLIAATFQAQDMEEAYDDLQGYYFASGQLSSARSTYEQLAVEHPDNAWPLVLLAELESAINAYNISPKPSSAADRALQMTEAADAFSELASSSFWNANYEMVELAAGKALSLVPDSVKANYFSGQALKERGDFTGAQQKFETCASAVQPSEKERLFQNLCYAELVTATRQITITLDSNQFLVQTKADLNQFSPRTIEFLAQGDPVVIAQRLAWGETRLDPGISRWSESLATFNSSVIIENGVVTNQEEEIGFDYFWDVAYYRFNYPSLTISNLPLTAYTAPTTITIITQGAQVISATLPYHDIQGNRLSWQLNSLKSPPPGLTLAIRPGTFHRLKLLWTTHPINSWAFIILHASSTVLSLIIFALIRRDEARARDTIDEDSAVIYQIFHPKSLFSWVFDLVFFIAAGFTLLLPAWLLSLEMEGIVTSNLLAWLVWLWLLPVIFARLVTLDWYRNPNNRKNFIHLGAIIFTCYFAPRLYYNVFMPVYLILAVSAYYLFVVHTPEWLERLDWQKSKQLFSRQRSSFIRHISSMNNLVEIEQATEAQDLALARGKIKPSEYKELRETLNNIIQENKEKLTGLRQILNLPEDVAPKHLLFGLGPKAFPFGNAIVAVGFGLIPFVVFLVLASWSQDNIFSSVRSTSFFALQWLLVNTVGVPWGPIDLFFFGFFFHVIRGNYGVTKGLTYALVLAGLNFIFQWLWLWDQIDGVELWGTTVRLLVTFVFTGLMIDWMTTQFSWRQIRLSYDSPAVTTVVSVIATALTTIVTGIATGTLNQLLNVAAQGTAAAFGITPPGGP